MVKKKKLKPSQIIILCIALVIYACMGLVIYFFLRPNDLVNINDKQLGICYDMMYQLKKENPKSQLFEISMEDHTMKATFKYIAQKVTEKEDWLKLADEIRTFITKYLSDHPDHELVTQKWKMVLVCPGAIYTNEADGEYTGINFTCAQFEKGTDLYTASGFLKNAASLGSVWELIVEDTEAELDEKTDLTGLLQMTDLKKLVLRVKSVTPALKEKLEELNIAVEIR